MKALGLAASLLAAACATSRVALAPPGREVRLQVPFFADDTDQCGPAALASVLGFWGKPEAPAKLKEDIYRARLNGSLTIDLLLAAEKRGLSAEMAAGDLYRIKKELDAGRPVIAFINTGYSFYPIGHFLVVTGYDDRKQCLFVHSGLKRNQPVSYRKFDRQWEANKRWALLIAPPAP